jgi:hypothetical protein
VMETYGPPQAVAQVREPGPPNRVGRTVALLTLLGFLLVTGVWKGWWLNQALTHYPVFDRGMNDPAAGRFFLLLSLALPVVVVVIAVIVSRSSAPLIEKLRKIGAIGCLVAVIPWLLLMVTGVAA